jgi:phosphatidylglycerol:prolipoprotein diacylglycerol transferase
MLVYPHIDPIAFNLWKLPVHWYGLMYLIGIFTAWILGAWRARESWRGVNPAQISDILFSGAVGLLIGGRLGYMFFYDTTTLFSHPFSALEIWNGGMSFHGGLIGAVLAVWFYSLKHHQNLFVITDFFAPMIPIGLGAGRLGNFINGELWGKVTSSPVGMVFPSGGSLPRYPSQLLEFFLEGVLLFLILWIFSRKKRPLMSVSGLFLLGYAIFRFTAEFFREPDPQRGYLLWGWLTEGQILSLPMLILGLILLACAYLKSREKLEN